MKNSINDNSLIISLLVVILFIVLVIVFLISTIPLTKIEKKHPTTKQICTNQEIWENRGSYPDFRCNMYNTKEGVVRECSTTKIALGENLTLSKEYLITTCLEVCVENC